jgi:putative endonuclease
VRLGTRGERIAASYLKRQGCRIITRNYTCPVGEIDLVALHDDTIVFVEVKTRSSDEAADPEIAVGHRKRRRLTRAAKHYLVRKAAEDAPCRFDVIAIVLPQSGDPQIEHFVDAFEPAPG